MSSRSVPSRFSALRARETESGVAAAVEQCTPDDLPPGEVVVQVTHSSLNYKDALSLQGNRGVTRAYPHTPGIDAAGSVVASDAPNVPEGMTVVVHGYDLGMNTWGGFSEYIRVPASWVVPLSDSLDPRTAMMYGTAGYTAALAVERIDRILQAREDASVRGPVVVSGAGGGVGSIAVAMLSGLGYTVTASTGQADDPVARQWLTTLGAEEVIGRDELAAAAEKPISKGRWIAGIDTTGGTILAGMVKGAAYGAPIASCGLTRDADLPLTVFPFILRAVQLIGIDSVHTPIGERRRVWSRIAGDLRQPAVETGSATISETDLAGVPEIARSLLHGSHRGRTVVRVTA
ncbi:MAG TPA: YhdH/YhfP family quinone oxidoreductase, partial [Alkalispirochaeta sp.]|nr:YhdH/YhfP family quinone oxidoreductase [Alkalispirochaeta sp.]